MRAQLLLGGLILGISTAASAQSDGPLHAAIVRAGRTTPLLPYGFGSSATEWSSVIRLAPGSEINLTESGGQTVRRTMVVADDSFVIALNLTSLALPEQAKKALVAMAVRAQERFQSLKSDSVRIVHDSVTLSTDGLFVGTAKVAELGEVVELIPREAVREVYLESHRGSLVWTAVGGDAGFVAGLIAGMALSEREANSCSSTQCSHVGSTAAVIGLPVAGAAIGYFGSKHERRDVIYRAPRQ